MDQNGNGIGHFQPISPHTSFQNADPSNLIISKLAYFTQTFSLHNQKTTYYTTLKTFFTVFNFHFILKELHLIMLNLVVEHRHLRPMENNLIESEIWLKLAGKADNRLFFSFVEKKVVESG